MSGSNSSRDTMTVSPGHHLSANERALLDRIRIPALRNLIAATWRLKVRLQFTGWLQYLVPALLAFLFLLVAGIAHTFAGTATATALLFVAMILFLVFAFDLVTVKFRLRPTERIPGPNDSLGLFDLMRKRRSCRSFQTRKLTPAHRDELMSSVERHTSEPKFGGRPIRFEYVSAPLSVWPTVNATEFLVAVAPAEYDPLAVIDVGHSLQKIVIDATRMGLGTCWIGPGADHESIMRHLADRFDPQKDHIICVCAVGYKSRFVPALIRLINVQFHRRLALDSLFFSDAGLEKPLLVDTPPFNQFGRAYEVCQWAPSSYNGQTTRCVAVTERTADGNQRPARFDFYASTESRYYAPVAVGIWCANWELGAEALGIEGHFAVISEMENHPRLPRYHISWLIDTHAHLT